MRKVSPISRHTPQSWFQSVTKPMAPWAQSFDPWPEIAKFPVDCPLNSTTKLNKEWPKTDPCLRTGSLSLHDDLECPPPREKRERRLRLRIHRCQMLEQMFDQELLSRDSRGFPHSSRVFSQEFKSVFL